MKKIPAITVMAVLGRRHQAPFDGLAAPTGALSALLASRDGLLILLVAKLRNSNFNLDF
jgi:hypothetical protein